MCRNGTIPQRALVAVGVATAEKEGGRERAKESSGTAGFGKCHATRTVDADGVGVESQVNSKRAPQTN